ncbi:hypothetical protein PVAG01_03193 [Phlyctema vagabunda]|uniref:Uncharacterized protein n=1 Tax=Phlyctema vagabunda TaxID=108571 RepID=A0ABR4PSR0_9HELO
MQLTNLFFTLLLSTAVVAKGGNNNGTKEVNDKSICKQYAKLTKLVDQASNTTKLESKTKNNATKIAEIQAKASTASVKLTEMSSNATLVSTCAVIQAADDTKDDCEKMQKLQKSIDLVNNSTKLEAKTKGNETKIAKLQAKATEATAKLAEMSSNTTLVDACSTIAADKAAKKQAKEASSSASGTAAAASATSSSTSAGSIIDASTGGFLSLIVMVAAGVLIL